MEEFVNKVLSFSRKVIASQVGTVFGYDIFGFRVEMNKQNAEQSHEIEMHFHENTKNWKRIKALQ